MLSGFTGLNSVVGSCEHGNGPSCLEAVGICYVYQPLIHAVRSAVAHLCTEITHRADSSWRSAADTLCPGVRRVGAPSRIPGSCRCRGSGGDSHYPKSGIRDPEARSAAPGVGASRCCNPLHHRQMAGRRSPLTHRLGHPRHPAAAWWRPPVDCSHLQACIHVCRLLMGMSASTRNAYS